MRHFVFIVLLLKSLSSFSQTGGSDFNEIKSGSIPPYYLFDVQKKSKQEAGLQDLVPAKDAEVLFRSANYYLQDLINSGTIYVNDEITEYLQGLVNKLTQLDPQLGNHIKVYTSRNVQMNAFCFADGSVVVNIGLLARLNSESQLAGILAHELAHYKNKHSMTSALRKKEISKSTLAKASNEGKLYLMTQHSREKEFEADAGAVTLLVQSPYNAEEIGVALGKLTANVIDSLPRDFMSEFTTDIFTPDTSYFSASLISRELKKSANRRKSFIKDNEGMFATHPDGERRVLAVRELLKAIEYVAPPTVDNSQFLKMKHKARFELCENNYLAGEYLTGLYEALILKRENPTNINAGLMALKNLFWLCRLKENGVLDYHLQYVDLQGSPSLAALKLFIIKCKPPDLATLLYSYIQKEKEKFSGHPDILFYQAAAAEMHLGATAAQIHYKNYASKFPQGKYINYVNGKLR